MQPPDGQVRAVETGGPCQVGSPREAVSSQRASRGPTSRLVHLRPSAPSQDAFADPARHFLWWPVVATLFALALLPLGLPLSWGRPRDPSFSLPSFPGQARGGGAEKQGAEGGGLPVKPRGKEVSRTAGQLQRLRSSRGSLARRWLLSQHWGLGGGGWPGAFPLLLVFVRVKN